MTVIDSRRSLTISQKHHFENESQALYCNVEPKKDAEKVISLADSAKMDKRQFQDAVDAMIPLQGSGNSISDALDVVSDNG